jgi:flagellar hook protein FlgE
VGKLVTGSLERSNVDIASEFTKLIVAQRAYTANTRVVTTSDEMLQETLNMRR